jgi:hypothetical protein
MWEFERPFGYENLWIEGAGGKGDEGIGSEY